MEYNIGIIDDDTSKITQLITFVSLGWEDDDGNLTKEKYKDIKLNPIEISLEPDIESMVEKVYSLKLDALIIDFKLSSQQSIAYSGVVLAQAIDKKLRGFPIFILTSYQDDLYVKESFDVYQVFDFARYIGELEERIEINSKIVEQIRKYNNTINKWKCELNDLIPYAGSSADIDERILELDSLIENSIDGMSSIPSKTKRDLSNANHLQLLIDKIDKLIGEE